MPGTIGNTAICANTAFSETAWTAEAIIRSDLVYTAVSGDVVTQFAIYGDGGPAIAEAAIYVFSGGLPTTRVGSNSTVNIGSSAGWHTATVSIPLTAGVTYCVAYDSYVGAGPGFNVRWGDTAGGVIGMSDQFSDATPLQATWVNRATGPYEESIYATVTTAASGVTGTIGATSADAVAAFAGTVTAPSFTGTIGATAADAVAALAGSFTSAGFAGSIAATAADAVAALVGTNFDNFTGTLAATAANATAAMTGVVGSSAGTIGYTAIAPLTDTSLITWTGEATTRPDLRYTANSGDAVVEVAVYGSGGPAQAEVAIYTWNGTVPVTRIGLPVLVNIGATPAWYRASCAIPLTAGVTYVVAYDTFIGAGPGFTIYYDNSAGNTESASNSTALDPTWSQFSIDLAVESFYATVGPLPGVSGTIGATSADSVAALVGTVTTPGSAGSIAAIAANATASLTGTTVAPVGPRLVVSGRKLLLNGSPYLLKAMSNWCCAQQGDPAQIGSFLDQVKALGFNAVTINPCGAVGGTAAYHQYSNYNGDPFFATVPGGTTPATPITGQLGKAWETVDAWFNACAARGMYVVFSMYTGYNNNQGIGLDLMAAGTSGARTYGQRVAARYTSYDNFIWHYGADWNFDWGTSPSDVVDALFRGITEIDGTDRLQVAEQDMLRTGYSQFISQQGDGTTGYGWLRLDINSLYRHEESAADELDAVYNETGATTYPVWNCEPAYEGATWWTVGTDAQELREQQYACFLRGGIGMNWGSEYIWSWGAGASGGGVGIPSPGDTMTNLSRTEVQRTQWAWNLFDSYVNDITWIPDQSWVTAGLGSGDTRASVGRSNTAMVAYFPSSRSITLDTTVMPGTGNVRIRWYDPTSNLTALITANEAQQAGRTVGSYQSNHADGSADWVIIVDLIDRSGTIAATSANATASMAGVVSDPTTGTLNAQSSDAVAALAGTITITGVAGSLVAVAANAVAAMVGTFSIPTTTTGLRIGDIAVSNMAVGDIPVSKVYEGDQQVWP